MVLRYPARRRVSSLSVRRAAPLQPWPRCPLAGQVTLGQNTVVGSMTVLLALLGNMPRGVCLAPHFCYKLPGPRFSGELPQGGYEMNMPGFMAEASLYRTSEHYHLVTNPGQAEGGIHPAQFESLVPVRCRHHFGVYCLIDPLTRREYCHPRYLGWWCD